MRKLLLLFIALLTGVSGAWAALSSSTISKSGTVTDTWAISTSMPTNDWTAMGEGKPSAITTGTPYYRTQNITISSDGALAITFQYTSGDHKLDILGVDLLNSSDEVVRSDYHSGYTGSNREHNFYMLDRIASGNYKIRFIIDGATVSSSNGNITVQHIDIKTASSFSTISQWYFVRMHSDKTNYMYYNGTSITFGATKANDDKYLWGFVKDTDGVKIYNKSAGSSVALDNADPCTLSAEGLSQTFTFFTGSAGNNGAAAGAFFSLYKITNSANSYLNYRTDNTIKRWGSNDTGSTFMIDESPIAGGKIYTLKAYFSDKPNLFFTNNDGTLEFNTAANNEVKDYWILRPSGNADYPWKFESGRGDGNFLSSKFGLTNTGVYLQINNHDSYFNLRGSKDGDATTSGIVNLGTWDGSKNTGFGAYGKGGCWASDGNNSSGGWTTEYTIEEVTGVDLYTVVSNIDAGGVTYTPSPAYPGNTDQTNGGFYILASAPSASDFSAKEVANYTPGAVTIDASAKTITLNYTANITYTLTDANGKTYSWSAAGSFGVSPTITGCDGYTLSNEVWNEGSRTYTADITFPFSVSSNEVTNWTYITNFSNTAYKFYWYTESASATRVVVKRDVYPTNENNTSYEWAIEPKFSNGSFTFTIKNNMATYPYVTSTSGDDNHIGAVTLSGEGSSLTYVLDGSYYRWALSTGKQLSINGSGTSDVQELGTWGTHNGTTIKIEDAADFTALLNNLKTAYTSYMNYFPAYNAGYYTQSVAGKMETAYANNGNVQKAIADPPTKYLTASDFQTFTDAYNNAVDGLNYVMPSGKFIRIKNVAGTKYVKDLVANYNEDETIDFSEGGTDATSIFYVDASNKMMAYKSGLYLFATNNTPRITLQSYADTYEFLKGSAPLQLYVHSANNPIGWGGDNRYWTVNESTSKIDRVASTTSASEFKIESVTSLPVTIGDAHYATFSAPVAVTVPEGVTAYKATSTGEDVMYLAPINSGNVIPANMGVILYAETPNTYNFAITDEEGSGSSILSGTTAAISWASGYYTLQKTDGGDGVGLYGNAPTNSVIPGFKAYYNSNSPSGVKGYRFNFGDENGVKTLEEIQGAIDNNEIFDMSGRRIAKAARGLYIVNGKKLLVK